MPVPKQDSSILQFDLLFSVEPIFAMILLLLSASTTKLVVKITSALICVQMI